MGIKCHRTVPEKGSNTDSPTVHVGAKLHLFYWEHRSGLMRSREKEKDWSVKARGGKRSFQVALKTLCHGCTLSGFQQSRRAVITIILISSKDRKFWSIVFLNTDNNVKITDCLKKRTISEEKVKYSFQKNQWQSCFERQAIFCSPQVQLPHLYPIGLLVAFMHQTNHRGLLATQSKSGFFSMLFYPTFLFMSFLASSSCCSRHFTKVAASDWQNIKKKGVFMY